MEVLYIEKENIVLHKSSEHLILKQHGRKIGEAPLVGIKTIVLFNNCQITSSAMELIFQKKIDLVYISKSGKLKGKLISLSGGGAMIRLAQHQAFMSKEKKLLIAQNIVKAKLHNQKQLISKYRRNYPASKYNSIISQFETYSHKIDTVNEMDAVMGFEGIAARLFWNCYRELLNQKVFVRREYRPAPDYINSALNFGYSLLVNEITNCLYLEKFDVEIGFLHSIFYGRNSLALDISEEFRTPFIDSWLLKVFNLNILSEKYFKTEKEGFYLNEMGISKFLESYHNNMEEGKWKQKFRLQSKKLREALIQDKNYEPYLWE